jgi:rod shape-determining protein MreC
MRSLLNFLIRYNSIIIFLLLEVFAFYLLSNATSYHNIKLSNASRATEAVLQKRIAGASEFFSLREINKALYDENLELRNRLERTYSDDEIYFFTVNDSLHKQQYIYTIARIVNQSVNKQKNFITLNKGSFHGIQSGMAIIGPEGIAGLIVGVSNNFSVGMSLLNLDFRLSARIRKNGYFGSLNWTGIDIRKASLNEIPHHVELTSGDTIETSGFSAIFPEGQLIGTISGFNKEGGDFYDIDVNLSTDFQQLSYVYIIGNLTRDEQGEIEEEYINTN